MHRKQRNRKVHGTGHEEALLAKGDAAEEEGIHVMLMEISHANITCRSLGRWEKENFNFRASGQAAKGNKNNNNKTK